VEQVGPILYSNQDFGHWQRCAWLLWFRNTLVECGNHPKLQLSFVIWILCGLILLLEVGCRRLEGRSKQPQINRPVMRSVLFLW